MGLHVVTGPATAGKSGILSAELERAALAGLPVLALPAAPDVHRATREFADRGVQGIRIVQLDRWIEQLWRLHGDGRRPVTDSVRVALAQRAILRSDTRGLGRVAETRGFRELVAQLVGLVPPDSAKVLAEPEAHIARVYAAYCQELENEGCIEPAEMARLLGADPPGDLSFVAVNRFTDLSSAQEAFLTGIAEVTDVSIALTWQDGLPATEALDPLVSRLLRAGARHTVCTEGAWTEPGLAALADGLYRGARAEKTPVKGLELIEAGGPAAECAAVAHRVRMLVDEGLDPARIAIIAKDMAGRADALGTALRASGIEADFDIAWPLASTGFGRALLGLLRSTADPECGREVVLAFVLSPYSGVEPIDASNADREWRRARLSGRALLGAVAKMSGAQDAVKLARQAAPPGQGTSWSARWHRLAALLLANAQRSRGLSGPGGLIDAAVHRSLTRTIDELSDSQNEVPLIEVIGALERSSVSTGSGNERAVQVTEAHRVRGRRFDTVVLMGLTGHEFASDRPTTLLTTLLRAFGEHGRADDRLIERMLFYTIVTRAQSRLILTRQSSNDRGEAVRASAFWDDVVDARPGVEPTFVAASDLADTAPSYARGRQGQRREAQKLERARAIGPHVDPAVLEDELGSHEFSASEIELYLACPYRWFVSRALRPRELDRAVDARERGTYAHGLLRAFYEQWNGVGHARVTPDSLDGALLVFAETEASFRETHAPKTVGTAETLALTKAARWARGVVLDDADLLPGFEPVGHEVAFGRASGDAFEFGGVSMAGRIDRVEKGPAGVLAIDYKSSSSVMGVGSFATGGLVQATVYAAAASRILGLPSVGGVYRSLRTLSVRGFWREGAVELGGRGAAADALDDDAVLEEFARAEAVVAECVESMRAGRLAPHPAKRGVCDYCALKGACGVTS